MQNIKKLTEELRAVLDTKKELQGAREDIIKAYKETNSREILKLMREATYKQDMLMAKATYLKMLISDAEEEIELNSNNIKEWLIYRINSYINDYIANRREFTEDGLFQILKDAKNIKNNKIKYIQMDDREFAETAKRWQYNDRLIITEKKNERIIHNIRWVAESIRVHISNILVLEEDIEYHRKQLKEIPASDKEWAKTINDVIESDFKNRYKTLEKLELLIKLLDDVYGIIL